MQRTKPKQVRIAVALLYAVLLVGLAQPFIGDSAFRRPPVILIVISAFVAIVTVFIIEYISIGRNWARITYFTLTFLGLPFSIMALRRHLVEGSHLASALLLGQLAVCAIAFYLLFFSAGRTWFSSRPKVV